jgi:hypothetical protein
MEMDRGGLNMKSIHKFITEDDVNDYKSITNDEIKKGILNYGSGFCFGNKGFEYEFDSINDEYFVKEKMKIEFRKLFGVPEGDLDVLLEQFREEGFTKYCRAGIWQRSFIKVLNNDGNIKHYDTWTSFFRYVNKWNQESELQVYKIIVDKNNKTMEITCDSTYENNIFISDGKDIYKISYYDKTISLSMINFFTDKYFSIDNDSNNDQLIEEFHLKETVKSKHFSLPIDKYFDKKFFYKGLMYNKCFDDLGLYSKIIIISIQVKNNLFYIEIENITYPHCGFILLDINEMCIVEAGRI